MSANEPSPSLPYISTVSVLAEIHNSEKSSYFNFCDSSTMSKFRVFIVELTDHTTVA